MSLLYTRKCNIKTKRFMNSSCTTFKCVNKYPFVEPGHKIRLNGHSPSLNDIVCSNLCSEKDYMFSGCRQQDNRMVKYIV